MPYVKKSSQASIASNHDSLVGAIVRELSAPQVQTLSQAAVGLDPYRLPCIIEGTIRNSDRLEVYVIWTDWSGVREEHRTAAILDAYERTKPDQARKVVIALGVTPDEAKELGVAPD